MIVNRRGFTAAVVAAVAAFLVTACSSGASRHNPAGSRPAPAPAPGSPSSTTELSFAFNTSIPTNWNVLASGAASDGLLAVADQVWPSVFSFGPSFVPVLNTSLVDSAQETSQSPQTVVYKINPRATWSDGVPVTGADFVYNWQAQSGRQDLKDVGGRPFTPAETAGYDQVQSVSVSPSSPDLVTVVFASAYPDWPSLFRHLVPAHVAETLGFDAGFTDPVTSLVSAGPFIVTAYDPQSGRLRLGRNPSFAGAPAAALQLDFWFLPNSAQLATAVASGEIDCAELPATAAMISQLKSARGLSLGVSPGPTYLDLEFDQASGPLRSADVRAAVTAAISRAAVAEAAVGAVEPGPPMVANRFLVPGEQGYSPHEPPGSATTSRPSSIALRLTVDKTDSIALAASTPIAEELQSAGIGVTVVEVAGAQALRSIPWDLTLEDRTLSPFPGAVLNAYSTGSPANLDGTSDSALDTLIAAAAASSGSDRMNLINQADLEAWTHRADLPLVALPQALACQDDVTGVGPNAAPDGPAFNAASWGTKTGS